MEQPDSIANIEERKEKLKEEREEIIRKLSVKKDKENHIRLLVRLMDVEDEMEELSAQKRECDS